MIGKTIKYQDGQIGKYSKGKILDKVHISEIIYKHDYHDAAKYGLNYNDGENKLGVVQVEVYLVKSEDYVTIQQVYPSQILEVID